MLQRWQVAARTLDRPAASAVKSVTSVTSVTSVQRRSIRRRWRNGVLFDDSAVKSGTSVVTLEPEMSGSEDSLFIELTQGEQKTDMMSEKSKTSVPTIQPDTSCSEDSLFIELTQGEQKTDTMSEKTETSVPTIKPDTMSEKSEPSVETIKPDPSCSETLSCASDETPTWIRESEIEDTGYQADEEAQEEEPCFYIDIEGEAFWFEEDDDFSLDDEAWRW